MNYVQIGNSLFTKFTNADIVPSIWDYLNFALAGPFYYQICDSTDEYILGGYKYENFIF